ncbi:hypothetical protein B0H16DRAFT_1892188 [Mycena metata]|uniref:Protein kinase domain-containing protein n=1 Tax=Mycena metata TaxID=1033252 RepID=A0AAD7I6W5_9AGAR|nr:hypothetical protein B0H16DRAFT_1892188 [Mycena metata]
MLGQPLTVSPDHSDSESDSASDSTLEDLDAHPAWAHGYPLQRVARYGSVDRMSAGSPSSSSGASDASLTSSIVYDIDFEQLVDDLLAEDPCPISETKDTVAVAASTTEANDSLMIKCLPASSDELIILLRLNHPDLREDPWNPAPHILCAVTRDERVFLCLRRLVEFNQPPLQIVSNYIDFFRQVLEGLTFLHEHSIAQLSCLDLSSYMVDLGHTTSSASDSVESFDRTRYPVRYYFTNLEHASEFESRVNPAFRKDVEDCAIMMGNLATAVPSISRKLNTLVNAMRTGTFDSDASRKLFEALCKALPADVFDIRVGPSGSNRDDQGPMVIASPATATPDPRSGVQHDKGPLQAISIPRKPKSTTLSPRARSRSPPPGFGRVRARSTEPPIGLETGD